MKKWEQPTINGLGINKTNDETDEKGFINHRCEYCGQKFKHHYQEVEHEATCPKNPANPPLS